MDRNSTSHDGLQEVSRFARTGVPERARSHRDAILAFLRERGTEGVLGSELYDAPHLYGRSPRNRISELRRDGYKIAGEQHGQADWRYWLIESDSADWYEREHGARPSGEISSELPLFSAVRP